MRKKRISQTTIERCLLTEVAPYETPVLFSNWGAYNYLRTVRRGKVPVPLILKQLFDLKSSKNSIPFKYRIRKDAHAPRTLFLLHPNCSSSIVSLYEDYSYHILKLCKRSPISLRAPSRVAKFYTTGPGGGGISKFVEEVTADSAYASSYFAYSQYSHLHKFFDSEEYADLEKKFAFMIHADVAKCFPSIYTHSISWAVRGKRYAKARLVRPKPNAPVSFDERFDKVMQNLNYSETHGIVIGPELSRIFAEIILQRIDIDFLKVLATSGLKEGEDFRCYRYIDDYFLFFNEQRVQDFALTSLKHELEKFRLYLNAEKIKHTERPFITEISILKIALAAFFKDLGLRLSSLDMRKSQHEVNQLRAMLKMHPVSVAHISSFALSWLERMIWRVDTKAPNYGDQLYVILELACHVLRMDIRVPCCFKWIGIAITVHKRLPKLAAPVLQRLNDKLLRELKGALLDAYNLGATVEAGNLLIVASSLFGEEVITGHLLEEIASKCRKVHIDEYSHAPRLCYFDIVCLLYAVKDIPSLAAFKAKLWNESLQTLETYEPSSYAETAHLFLDLTACPWLNAAQKTELVTRTCAASSITVTPAEIAEFINFVGARTWFFNWDHRNSLNEHLKKKKLLLSY